MRDEDDIFCNIGGRSGRLDRKSDKQMYRRQLISRQMDASVRYMFSHLFLLVFSSSLESEESKTSGCALSMRKNRADRNRDTRM